MLKNMSSTDRLDFTNGLVTFVVGRKNDRGVIDALMPGLDKLADDNNEIKKSLLNQLKPLIELFTNKFGDEGYTSVTKTAFPILSKLLYDNDEFVRDKAIQVVGEMRKLVRDNEKEIIMKLTLDLAHDENEKLRESAVKLLNELAPDMGKELCEVYIVTEMFSLGYDQKPGVR